MWYRRHHNWLVPCVASRPRGVPEIVGNDSVAVAPGDAAALQLGALTLGRHTV
jgi:hypothetical protein